MEPTERDTLDGQGSHVVDGNLKRGQCIEEHRPDSDVVLSALADEQRRAILRLLDRDNRNSSDLDALVDEIHDDSQNENAPADAKQRIRIRLHHVDLPKLEAAGLIEYDADAKRVRGVEDAFARQLRSAVDENGPTNRSG